MVNKNRSNRRVSIQLSADGTAIMAKTDVGGYTDFKLTIVQPGGEESAKGITLNATNYKIIDTVPEDGARYIFVDSQTKHVSGDITFDLEQELKHKRNIRGIG